MSGQNKTKIVSIRIPWEQYYIIERRWKNSDPLKYPSISAYIAKRYIYDLHR